MGGRAVRDDAAGIEPDDPVERAGNEACVVADRDDGPALRGEAGDDPGNARDLGRVQPHGRLVEHDDRGSHRQHACQSEQAPPRAAEVVRVRLGPLL